MARARNIKPGFFTNDLLAEIAPLGRLLFQGLWCHADREGRLFDRPKKLKAEILPYDECDVESLLSDLEKHGFIIRYVIDSIGYIQVQNFLKHQNPHVKEQASEIPAPCKNSASTVQEQDKHGSCPADSLNPHPLTPSPSLAESAPATQPPKQKRGSVIPDDFYPNATGIEYLDKRRLSLAVELGSFRNWHKAKGSTMKDWQAAWRTWCDKAVEFGRAGVQANGARASPRDIREAENRRIMDELTGRNRANEQRNERDITGEAVRVA